VGRGVILGTDLHEEAFSEFADKIIPNNSKVGYKKK
jgi:hypothetical protein